MIYNAEFFTAQPFLSIPAEPSSDLCRPARRAGGVGEPGAARLHRPLVREDRVMKRVLMVMVMVVLGLSAASTTQAQVRPDCLDPDGSSGACFLAEGGNFGAGFADAEGDALRVDILDGDENEFIRVNPDGTWQAHGQSKQAQIIACRAANFPACLFDPSLLLFGEGTWVFTGRVNPSNLQPQCPFVMNVTGLVSSPATGERFRVQAKLIGSADPDDPTCSAFAGDTRVFDVKIVPLN